MSSIAKTRLWAVITVAVALAPARSRAADAAPAKIGIIGTGKIGGTLAELWVKAGHEVLISSRHPEELQGLAKSLGPKARAGTPREAAVFGDVGDKRNVMEIARHDLRLLRQRVAGRYGTKRIARRKQLMRHARQVDLLCRQAQIELPRRDQIPHLARREHMQRDADRRMLLPEATHGARDE